MCHGGGLLPPHADALIHGIEVAAALASPGVIAVLTGALAEADGLGGLLAYALPEHWGGPRSFQTEWKPLATGRVRTTGDRVAFVVAETAHRARDAAERIVVEYEPLPARVTAEQAVAPGAAEIWPGCPGNVCFALEEGDAASVDAAFGEAAHVVMSSRCGLRIIASRRTRWSRGPPSAYGTLARGRYTLHTSSQNPHGVRAMLARAVLRTSERNLRVIAPDVGGGFGGKANPYPEDALVLWAARRTAGEMGGHPIRGAVDPTIMGATRSLSGRWRWMPRVASSRCGPSCCMRWGPISPRPARRRCAPRSAWRRCRRAPISSGPSPIWCAAWCAAGSRRSPIWTVTRRNRSRRR